MGFWFIFVVFFRIQGLGCRGVKIRGLVLNIRGWGLGGIYDVVLWILARRI